MAAASRPISATARAWRATGAASGAKSWPLPSPPRITASLAALGGLGVERKVVLILGGEGKGQDFAPLAEPVGRYARAVVLIGRDAPLIEQAIASSGVALLHAATMPEAVQRASERAQPGDAVLLSPACASFDMFKDYAHRAAVFCEAVQELADAAHGGHAAPEGEGA